MRTCHELEDGVATVVGAACCLVVVTAVGFLILLLVGVHSDRPTPVPAPHVPAPAGHVTLPPGVGSPPFHVSVSLRPPETDLTHGGQPIHANPGAAGRLSHSGGIDKGHRSPPVHLSGGIKTGETAKQVAPWDSSRRRSTRPAQFISSTPPWRARP